MNLHPISHAATRPDHPAVIMTGSGEQMSYGELDAAANRFANLLQSRGMGPTESGGDA
ncbi:MAG: AMP-binding protein, partial [Pseudomonadota bacterium]